MSLIFSLWMQRCILRNDFECLGRKFQVKVVHFLFIEYALLRFFFSFIIRYFSGLRSKKKLWLYILNHINSYNKVNKLLRLSTRTPSSFKTKQNIKLFIKKNAFELKSVSLQNKKKWAPESSRKMSKQI